MGVDYLAPPCHPYVCDDGGPAIEALARGDVHTFFAEQPPMGSFSLLVFTLAIVGTYGVASYGVSERTGELGVRVALGATANDIRRLVLGDGVRLALIGIGIGGVAAAALSRLLTRFVFQISTLDAVTFTVAPILLGAAALLVASLLGQLGQGERFARR